MGHRRRPRNRSGLRAAMTIGLLAAALVLCGLAAPPLAGAEPLRVEARPVLPNANGAARVDLGRLVWRGGLELRSEHMHFGGLSGLLVAPDGSHLTAVSDAGVWVSIPLIHDADGRLIGAEDGTILPLRGPGGGPVQDKWDSDAESLARMADGSLVVAFERNHRLWLYPASPEPLSGIPRTLAGPAALGGLRRNSGIESLTELADGALLAIAEGQEQDVDSLAFVRRDGRWSGLSYLRGPGFRPTGAARLPGGDVLVVERRFNVIDGLGIRLVRIAGSAIEPAGRLDGEVLALLEPPVTLDNMEGIAAAEGADGETLIYLLSDDNFNGMQRTLLLLFELSD